MRGPRRGAAIAIVIAAVYACGDAPPATVDAPVIDAPVIDAPVIDGPVIDAPVIDAPVIDAPLDACTTACVDGDQCCPATCGPFVDDDCVPQPLVDLGAVATDADLPGRMFRDAGYSTPIPGTNRSFWIFADSLVRNDNNTGCWPVFGIIPDGTAATAVAQPGAVQLQEDPDNVCGTARFLTVSPSANAACRAYANPVTGEMAMEGYLALWPRSTVGLPGTNPGSVLVFYQAFCNKPTGDDGDPATPRPWVFHPLATGVARWDSDDNPIGAAPTVLPAQQWDTVFAGQGLTSPPDDAQRSYSSGAVVDDQPGVDDDYLYLFRHHGTGLPGIYRAVQVARVRLYAPALKRYRTATNYEYWYDNGWHDDDLPPADDVGLIATSVQTPDNISVVWYPPLGRYVMTYSQFQRTVAGLSETQIGVRTSPAPQGGWSAERVFSLPAAVRTGDCGPEAGSAPCRHYFAHPEHSRPGGLTISVIEPTFGGRSHLYEIPDSLLQ